MKRRDKLITQQKRRKKEIWEMTPAEELAFKLNEPDGSQLEEMLCYAHRMDKLLQIGNISDAKKLCDDLFTLLRNNTMFYSAKIYESWTPQFHYELSQYYDPDNPCISSEDMKKILEMLKRGRIDRIRRCEQCKTWIAARVKAQRFCSKECRQTHFESRTDVRERRNAARCRRYHLARHREKQRQKLIERELGTRYKRRAS